MKKILKQHINDKVTALQDVVATTRKCLKTMMKRGYKVGLALDHHEGKWNLSNNRGFVIIETDVWKDVDHAISLIEAYKQ